MKTESNFDKMTIRYPDMLAYEDDAVSCSCEAEEPEDCQCFDVVVPATVEVCWRCNGRGVHDPEGFSNGFTSDEMYEAGPEFQEEYMAGRYDVTCTECRGRNVVLEVDRERADPAALKLIDEWEQSAYELRQMEAAERRMGC